MVVAGALDEGELEGDPLIEVGLGTEIGAAVEAQTVGARRQIAAQLRNPSVAPGLGLGQGETAPAEVDPQP